MEKFWKLNVFHKAHQLVLEVYKITKKFPNNEKFALVSQMQRSAVSVVANIVEGTKRRTIKDQSSFNTIAGASLEELKYYFYLSSELGYIKDDNAKLLIENAREIGAMLSGYNKAINKFK